METTKVKKPSEIKDLLELREVLRAKVDRIFATVDEIETLCKAHFDYGLSNIEPREQYKEKHYINIDAKCWRAFLELSAIQTIMTKKAISDMHFKLQEKPPPFIDREVMPIIKNARQFYGTQVENTIRETYNSLIGCGYSSGSWRSDKKDNLNKVNASFRIYSGCISRWEWSGSQFQYRTWESYKRFDYEDLFTVFKLLDGERRTDYASSFAVCAERDLKEKPEVNCGYFSVRCFKNGNQLVTIHRLDLLQMFNQYGADPSALPDHMKKRYKPEHFKQDADPAPADDKADEFTEMELSRAAARSIHKQIEANQQELTL